MAMKYISLRAPHLEQSLLATFTVTFTSLPLFFLKKRKTKTEQHFKKKSNFTFCKRDLCCFSLYGKRVAFSRSSRSWHHEDAAEIQKKSEKTEASGFQVSGTFWGSPYTAFIFCLPIFSCFIK